MIGPFTKVDDIPDWLLTDRYYAEVADGQKICIYKHQVLYGYRLWAGYVDMDNYQCTFNELNICAGPNKEDYDRLFAEVIHRISNNSPDDPFRGIPEESNIKPYYRDLHFCLDMGLSFRG